MRFADRITFVKEVDSYYDPVKGEYVEGEPIKTTVPCKLSALGTERTIQLFGELDKKLTVARLQQPYHGHVDYVEIKEISYVDGIKNTKIKKYNVKRQSDYRKGVFYLEGVSNG
ncbi:hypothetical protein [Ornithinibacillus sp. JPR2-1]|uniref:hypothetical protein n=1 Tax=Ornithinibacillus sp. JPR2-1 TaxID=2094019 RepID=UPI0031D83979